MLKQVGTRPDGHCNMWPPGYLKVTSKMKHFYWWNVFDDVCWICRWSWFDVNRYARKTIYSFSFPVTYVPLDLKFASLVTLVQRCVSTKLEVSTVFLLWECRMYETDGQMDRQAGCNA